MSNLSKSDAALLQARHAYNDAKILEITEPTGFTQGSQDVVIRMNRMAWGLFEATILRAFKEREDLRARNPELVSNDVTCDLCKGVGGFPYSDEENERLIAEHNEGLDPSDYFYSKPGTKWSKFCSPCQGTGIVLKELTK